MEFLYLVLVLHVTKVSGEVVNVTELVGLEEGEEREELRDVDSCLPGSSFKKKLLRPGFERTI